MAARHRQEIWNTNPTSRTVQFPDGLKRILTLPDWAWAVFDTRNKKAFDAAIHLSWSRATQYGISEAFDYMMVAQAHSDQRRFMKFDYYLSISDDAKIPGKAKIPINDHYDPKRLPDFPDPFWTEAESWSAYEQRMRELFIKDDTSR